ncbi:hypothetical protein [Prochlorococcus sp. MIT 1307]|uniref:hypothetical protein n=1 Tax=Prochlorococcus sp. MIT 1307 TaxID=3096219 RepID=UPI002A749BF0|nr:hypothetical protein [Prochlorococcus sp. MIT 1307]
MSHSAAITDELARSDNSYESLQLAELSPEITKKLSADETNTLQAKIIVSNNALSAAGQSVYKAAKSLSEIKKLVKNKQWVQLTNSNILRINGRVARDLASAFDSWLCKAEIPESALIHVSARTLAKIGKVEKLKQDLAISIIKQGNGFKESDLSMIIKQSSVQKRLPELIQQAISTSNQMKDSEKIERFETILIENIKLKHKIKVLEAEIIELKLNRATQSTTKSIAKKYTGKKSSLKVTNT